jgi:hypothetical protein
VKPDDEISLVEERLEVLRAQQGDREAFRRLVGSYERRVLHFMRYKPKVHQLRQEQMLDILQDLQRQVADLRAREQSKPR